MLKTPLINYCQLSILLFLGVSCGRYNCKLSPYGSESYDTHNFEPCTAQLLIEGSYQGKNVYIQNPSLDTCFCTCEIILNGASYPGDIKGSAYEIDLSSFKIGDSVKIQITHNSNCKPKVLNPMIH